MFDGRVQVYRRGEGRFWQCAARVGERRFRESTKEESLDRAKDVAEEWYLDLRGKLRHGEIVRDEPTFGKAAELYISALKVLSVGERSPKYVELTELRMRRHVIPFFKDKPLSEVNRALAQAYRMKRNSETIDATGKPPARSTMDQEFVCIRQVLKQAEDLGWIQHLPTLTPPYKSKGKKARRAWFSPEEYIRLYTATKKRMEECKRPGWELHYADLHDFVLFMANSGLRPDEAINWLELRDVVIERDDATKKEILVIDVRGKTGTGYCKTMPGAVLPFRRLRARRQLNLELAEAEKTDFAGLKHNALIAARRKLAADLASGERKPKCELPPATKVFPRFDRATFNVILKEEGLKFDRDGRRRTAYSLRHTYISTRLMEGANIHQLANNCRTSVKMIEEHYAAHIRDRLDAAALNVQRSRRVRNASRALGSREQPSSGATL